MGINLFISAAAAATIGLVQNGFFEESAEQIDSEFSGGGIHAACVIDGLMDPAVGNIELVGDVVDVGHVANVVFG